VDVPVVLTTWEMVNVDGVERPIWKVPEQRAAGWHEGSAPLGLSGNTVLNAHNTTYGEAFRDLYLLEVGNQILIYSDEEGFDYQVEEILFLPEAGQPIEVRLENARYIQPSQDERVTLVTCHPYASLQYRLVIIARPVTPFDPEAGTQED
jgi:sortase A